MNLRKHQMSDDTKLKIMIEKETQLDDNMFVIINGKVYQVVNDETGGCDNCDINENDCGPHLRKSYDCDNSYETILKDVTDKIQIKFRS